VANSCLNSPTVDPILHFDERAISSRASVQACSRPPTAIFVDKDGNIWVTDYQDNGAAAARGGAPGTRTRPRARARARPRRER